MQFWTLSFLNILLLYYLFLLFRFDPSSAIAMGFEIKLLLLLFYRLGSLFTARKMDTDNLNLVKKFLQVFAKRIAKTASAPKCQTCECNSDDNGISYMDCYPCSYPTAANIEYVSRNKRMLHVHLQSVSETVKVKIDSKSHFKVHLNRFFFKISIFSKSRYRVSF